MNKSLYILKLEGRGFPKLLEVKKAILHTIFRFPKVAVCSSQRFLKVVYNLPVNPDFFGEVSPYLVQPRDNRKGENPGDFGSPSKIGGNFGLGSPG